MKQGAGCGLAVVVLVGVVALIPLLVIMAIAGGMHRGAQTAAPSSTSVAPLDAGKIPEQYRAALTAAAAQCPDVPAAVMAAQINAESRWSPTAVSPVGAQGIAQFMPATWASYGVDGNSDGRADPLDPGDALPAMARYNCDNLATVDQALASGGIRGDRIELMLAAYNAGFGAVSSAGGIPNYAETQKYVRKIMASAASYSQPSTAPAGTSGNAIVQAARAYTGIPYVWGGESRAGVDCSGLVLLAVHQATGKKLEHLADSQIRSSLGTDVPADLTALQPGDVIGFSGSGGANYDHIGIYVGGGRMIHAPQTGDVVKESDLSARYWTSKTWKAKRF